jgi:hypothetical protein
MGAVSVLSAQVYDATTDTLAAADNDMAGHGTHVAGVCRVDGPKTCPSLHLIVSMHTLLDDPCMSLKARCGHYKGIPFVSSLVHVTN